MIINKFQKRLPYIAITALLFLNLHTLSAQTIPNCDPWPTDTDQMLNCIDYYNEHQLQVPSMPGTDPSNPVTLSFSGQRGIDGAYSPDLDQVLIVGWGGKAGTSEQILGQFVDPKTMEPKGSAFRIDSGAGYYRGKPKIIYSKDSDEFLVAWEEDNVGANRTDIFGRILAGNGTFKGAEFRILPSTATFFEGLTYDTNNKNFAVFYEGIGKYLAFKTVDLTGSKISDPIIVVNSFSYQGQGQLTYNASTNEYWAAYVSVKGPQDVPTEDDRIMLSRISAATLKPVGQPIQLSQTRVGRNNLADAHIDYDPVSNAAVAVWMERGRDQTAGTWGRSILTDGTLGREFPVITPTSYPGSIGYEVQALKYNPYTGTFFAAANDWDGGTETIEFNYSGYVFSVDQVISVPQTSYNLFERLLAIHKALAAAVGIFNPAIAVTPYGSVTLGSKNFVSAVGTTQPNSINQGFTSTTTNPVYPPIPLSEINLGPISIQINQIYIWSLAAAALLALFMIVIGGYITLTARGNAAQASKGKTYITSSIIGLVLLFGAYILLNTINPDLVNFRNIDITTQPK